MNELNLPEEKDAKDFNRNGNTVRLVTITPENQKAIVEAEISNYVGEPCRICGLPITREDIHNGARWAGRSKCGKSRLAHDKCWEIGCSKKDWAYPEDAKRRSDDNQ